MEPIAKKTLAFLEWRGWEAGGINHPDHGRINVTEALRIVCEGYWDVYTEFILRMCDVISVGGMIDLVMWEQNKSRTFEDIEWLLQRV